MLRNKPTLLAGVLGSILVLLLNTQSAFGQGLTIPPLPSNDESVRREDIDGRLCSTKFGCAWLLPVATRQCGSDDFEHKNRAEGYRTRAAWDLTAPIGTRVYAMADGEVIIAHCIPFEKSNGCEVAVKHADGYISLVGHLQDEGDGNYLNGGETLVQVGDHVTRFTVIGHVGMTGQTQFEHTHFYVRMGSGVDLQAWTELLTENYFDINKMNKAYLKPPQADLMEVPSDVQLAQQADEPATQSVNGFLKTSFGDFFGNPLEDLIVPAWIFIMMFTIALILRIKLISILMYFVWRWGLDPIVRAVIKVGREENAIHMRSQLFQRIAVVSLFPYLILSGAVGWAQGVIASPHTRPVMERLIAMSEDGVKVTSDGTRRVGFSKLPSLLGIQASGAQIPWLPVTVEKWAYIFDDVARSTEEAEALRIIMLCESCGFSAARSGVGADGPMQVMPATFEETARNHGLPADADRTDPAVKTLVGIWYYQDQLDAFGGDFTTAAVAYNGGPGAAQRYQANGLSAIASETQSYHKWFSGMWNERHDESSPTFEAWVAAGGSSLCESASYEDSTNHKVDDFENQNAQVILRRDNRRKES